VQNPPPPQPPSGLPPPPPPPVGYPPPPPPPGGYAPAPYQPGIGPAYQPAYASQIPYAGFWIRFIAIVADNIILFVALVVLFIVIELIAGVAGLATGQSVDTRANGAGTLANLISFVVSVGYFIYFWGMGQTPGMRVFHLAVVDANTGAPIGFGRAALRYLGFVIASLVCDIGLIWAAFDGRKQGWHDKIANTVVVHL